MLRAIAAAALALLASTAFGQQTYYVSTTGSDGNPGTEILPWQTVQYGLDELSAGDTLNIMSGAYNEKVQVNVSGSAGSPITIRSFGAGESVLDGSGLTAVVPIIEIYDQSYIVVDGLTVTNNAMLDAQGILIENNCTDITIRNTKISNIHFSSNPGDPVDETTNAQPLIVYGSDAVNAISNLLLEGNQIFNCRTGFSEALAVNGNVDGFSILNNNVHDITNIGIDVIGHEGTSSNPATDQARNGVVRGNTITDCISAYATSGGIYVDGARDIIIERNISFHNGYGIEVGCENVNTTAENIIVRDNLLFNNEVAGIALGGFDYPTGSGKVVNAAVSNNSLYSNDFSSSFTGELYLSYSEGSSLVDNIISTSGQNVVVYAEASSPGLDLDYNLYDCPGGVGALEFHWNGTLYTGLTDFQTATGLDANSLFGDPSFVSAALPDPDLHLQVGSPAIDRGDPAFVAAVDESDIDGDPRIINGRVDIGADELEGGVIFNDGFESGDTDAWTTAVGRP